MHHCSSWPQQKDAASHPFGCCRNRKFHQRWRRHRPLPVPCMCQIDMPGVGPGGWGTLAEAASRRLTTGKRRLMCVLCSQPTFKERDSQNVPNEDLTRARYVEFVFPFLSRPFSSHLYSHSKKYRSISRVYLSETQFSSFCEFLFFYEFLSLFFKFVLVHFSYLFRKLRHLIFILLLRFHSSPFVTFIVYF